MNNTIKTSALLQHFRYMHLPDNLKTVCKPFTELAVYLNAELPEGDTKYVALTSLLDSKNAALRTINQSESE